MYTWDEVKRLTNLTKHGLDFADAHVVYENPEKTTFASIRHEEARMVDLALVKIAGVVLALIYVERGDDVQVISFRRASRKERSIYEQAIIEE